jgi:predicted enzyme related to lactoylglutathione lyase
MVVRSGYVDGEPCWADAVAPDMEAAKRFYGEVLGWTFADTKHALGDYTICLKNDQPVAALTPPESTVGGRPAWNTYLKTTDAHTAAERIEEAGGKLVRGPVEFPGGSRVLLALDPGGAVFGAWEPGSMAGARVYGEPGAITWADVNTRAPAAVDAFYGTVFGVEAVAWSDIPEEFPGDAPPEQTGMDYVVYKGAASGPMLCGRLTMTADLADVPPNWMIFFNVEDADSAADRVAAAGGLVAVAPFDTPYGRMTVVADPNGAILGLSAAAIAKSRLASWGPPKSSAS